MQARILLMSLIVSATAGAGEFFREGQTAWHVSVQADAAKPVAYAAEELTNALFRISGAKFPVATSADDVGPNVICIRATGTDGETSVVRTERGGLVLEGDSPRAALYAVYDFLENELDVRWYWSDKEGSFYPARKFFKLPEVNRTSKPHFAYRGMVNYLGKPEAEIWAARNRMNAWSVNMDIREKAGYLAIAGNHLIGLGPKDRERHADLFGIRHGERIGTAGCWTNPKFLDYMVECVIRYCDRMKLDIVQPFPADVTGRCECKACVEDRKDGMAWWRFYAKLRQKIRLRRPNLKFAALAYQEYRDLPRDFAGNEDLLFVEYAQYNRCYVHAAADKSCAINDKSFAELKDWSKVAKIGIYGYDYDLFEPRPYLPFWNMLADQARAFRDAGAVSVHTEYPKSRPTVPRAERSQECSRLSGWIYARLLCNPDADVSALVDDFCCHVYGPGAWKMSEYHHEMAKAWDAQKAHYSYFGLNPASAAVNFLSEGLITASAKRLAAARANVNALGDDDPMKLRWLENIAVDEAQFTTWKKYFDTNRRGRRSVAVVETESFEGVTPLRMTSHDGRAQPTTVRVRAATDALVVRVDCTETNMPSVVLDPNNVFGRDAIEVFIEPPDGQYRHFATNPAGGRYDALGHDSKFAYEWCVAPKLGKGSWSVEMSFPFKSFGLARPKMGETWKMVVDRCSSPEFAGFPKMAVHDMGSAATLYFCGKAPVGRSLVWFCNDGAIPTLSEQLLADGWTPWFVPYADAENVDFESFPMTVISMRYQYRNALNAAFFERLKAALLGGQLVVVTSYGAPNIWDWFHDPDLKIGDELYKLGPAKGVVPPGVFMADKEKWEWLKCRQTADGADHPYLMRRKYGKGTLVLSLLHVPVDVLNEMLEAHLKGLK